MTRINRTLFINFDVDWMNFDSIIKFIEDGSIDTVAVPLLTAVTYEEPMSREQQKRGFLGDERTLQIPKTTAQVRALKGLGFKTEPPWFIRTNRRTALARATIQVKRRKNSSRRYTFPYNYEADPPAFGPALVFTHDEDNLSTDYMVALMDARELPLAAIALEVYREGKEKVFTWKYKNATVTKDSARQVFEGGVQEFKRHDESRFIIRDFNIISRPTLLAWIGDRLLEDREDGTLVVSTKKPRKPHTPGRSPTSSSSSSLSSTGST